MHIYFVGRVEKSNNLAKIDLEGFRSYLKVNLKMNSPDSIEALVENERRNMEDIRLSITNHVGREPKCIYVVPMVNAGGLMPSCFIARYNHLLSDYLFGINKHYVSSKVINADSLLYADLSDFPYCLKDLDNDV